MKPRNRRMYLQKKYRHLLGLYGFYAVSYIGISGTAYWVIYAPGEPKGYVLVTCHSTEDRWRTAVENAVRFRKRRRGDA